MSIVQIGHNQVMCAHGPPPSDLHNYSFIKHAVKFIAQRDLFWSPANLV
jgi:hypothetical protein